MTGSLKGEYQKKNIAIVSMSMETGGVEKALVQMLRRMDFERCSIDLYLVHKRGELLGEIPPEIEVFQIPTVKAKDVLKHPVAVLQKAACMYWMKRKKLPFIEQSFLSARMLLPIGKYYDTIISYHAPNTVPVFYVIDCMKAQRKVLWLHGDLDTNEGASRLALKYHTAYDKVVGVAKSIIRSYLKYHPDAEAKTEVIYNYTDMDEIRKKAIEGETFADTFNGVRILTIGRLTEQKGYDMAIHVCRRLADEGYRFRWYVLGEGELRLELEEEIRKKGLDDTFRLLGNKSNPYGYLSQCDFYVQTSRFEGFCTTTNEAKILGKTVITTDVSGAREQFKDGYNGWIVPISEDAIYERLKWCLDHPERSREVSGNIDQDRTDSGEKISWLYET